MTFAPQIFKCPIHKAPSTMHSCNACNMWLEDLSRVEKYQRELEKKTKYKPSDVDLAVDTAWEITNDKRYGA